MKRIPCKYVLISRDKASPQDPGALGVGESSEGGGGPGVEEVDHGQQRSTHMLRLAHLLLRLEPKRKRGL